MLSPAGAQRAAVCPALPLASPPPHEAVPEDMTDPNYRTLRGMALQRLAQADRAGVEIAFLGDSITEAWDFWTWAQFYAPRHALNLGVGGDTTQGLLWRLQNGAMDGITPRLVVLMIGTNNLSNGSRPEDIGQGVAEILRWLREHQPRAKLLLIGVLPRGGLPGDPLRARVTEVNKLISRCADGGRITFTDPGPLLIDVNGTLSPFISYDSIHLTQIGYIMFSSLLEATVRRVLAE